LTRLFSEAGASGALLKQLCTCPSFFCIEFFRKLLNRQIQKKELNSVKKSMNYNPQETEKKWRKKWEEEKTFQVNLEKAEKPYYNLMMFPYPSAEGLHVGNVYAFTGSDIHGRLRRMQGYDVFEPMGFDAFGIHSENFAIKKGIHPTVLIKNNVDHFREQLKNLGCLFDWRHEVDTTQPNYYKWTQWLFLQLYKKGLAFRKKAPVDWCPSCKTVLADEQVIKGKCERCDSEVIQKETEQWFLKITQYADKLLKNLDQIDWPETTKTIQRNWIGKSEGHIVKFKIKNQFSESKEKANPGISVFTTRVDTLFGCTYLVVAPEHPIIKELESKILNPKAVIKYVEESCKKTDIERISRLKDKTGIELQGIKAVNPVNDKEIPIFVADYVVVHYGTGAVMAVPAHDQRDYDFARKYNLSMIEVIQSPKTICKIQPKYADSDGMFLDAYEGEGILINSGRFTGLKSETARARIGEWLAKKGLAEKTTFYKLRDWLISRQRYWGPPIPIIYCQKCGTVPVAESDLPVLLPFVKDFKPEGAGRSPLANVESFVNTKCPKCKGPAKRETDVSDTFLDSSWYFLRYPSTDFDNKPIDEKTTEKWLPVSMYIGGQEHAVLHLMYTRFVTMALHDLELLNFEEPFQKFRINGLITNGGVKMSKSKGNVVNPDEYYQKYGVDTLRMYLMFLGPFSYGGDWQDKGILGIRRFLEKVWKLGEKDKTDSHNPRIDSLVNDTIRKVTNDIENLQYNTAISSLMILANEMSRQKNISEDNYSALLIALAPFAPYITEELWSRLGGKGSVHNQEWPRFSKKKAEKATMTIVIQVNGRVRDQVEVPSDISEKELTKAIAGREKVRKWIAGDKIKKVIYVPKKLVNIVV